MSFRQFLDKFSYFHQYLGNYQLHIDIFGSKRVNVNGLGDRVKHKAIFQSIKDKKVDLCLRQKTHSTHQTHLLWKNEWGGDIHFIHGTSNSCGVAILIRRGLNIQILDKIIDPSGRYMIMKMNIEGSELILGNLYAPTQDKENDQLVVLNQLKEQLMPFSDEPILLGGTLILP